MAKRKTTRRRRARANSSGTTTRRRRRSNPVKVIYRTRKKRSNGRRGRRRSNPSFGGVTSMLMKGAYGAIGAVGSRTITQAVLGGSNSGVLGLGGQAISAMLLGWGATKFLGREAGNFVSLGGWIGLALRIAQDFTPYGKVFALSGGGDLGALLPSNFVEPPLFTDIPGQRNIPAGFGAPAHAGMRGLGASSYAVSSYR
jgi:hypothetical protein